MDGLENEENARQMVQIDLQTKIRSDISSRAAAAAALLVLKSVRLLEDGQVVRSQDRRCWAQRLIYATTNGVQRLGHGLQAVHVPRAHRHRSFESHQ